MAQPRTDLYATTQSHDRLGFSFCLALALHAAIILGVSFSPEQRQLAATKLEVTLAQFRSEDAPDQADFRAQHSQLGSGTLEEKVAMTTTEHADFQDNVIREVSPSQQQAAALPTEPDLRKLLLSQQAEQKVSLSKPTEARPEQPNNEQASDMSIVERSREIASLEAKLDIQRQAYAKRPRIRRLTSVATQQADDALYTNQWIEKIELIGNQHYPEQARQQGIFGELQMVVSLFNDGSIHDVKIIRSSGYKILDEAALRIVHQAAPYGPFPTKMRQQVDILEIIRTWRFHKNRLTSSS